MAERLVSLISGGGSTMEAIGCAIRDGGIPGLEFGGVIASNTSNTTRGVDRALSLGVPIVISDPERYRGDDGQIDQYGFGQELQLKLNKMGATVVTQNGWLPWTPDNVIDAYMGRIFNQHPGPVPETAKQHGTMPHQTMIEFVRLTGRNEGTEVIAQRVHPEMDKGNLVGWTRVDILEGDDGKKLQERALTLEHALQITMLNEFVRGSLRDTRQVHRYMRPGEELILKEARRLGRKAYPEG